MKEEGINWRETINKSPDENQVVFYYNIIFSNTKNVMKLIFFEIHFYLCYKIDANFKKKFLTS